MTSHVIAYRSLELLFGTHTFHFNCFFEDFNCVFTQIRCLSRVLLNTYYFVCGTMSHAKRHCIDHLYTIRWLLSGILGVVWNGLKSFNHTTNWLNYSIKCHSFRCWMENSVNPDQQASSEASWSGSTLFSKKDNSMVSRTSLASSGFWLTCRCRSMIHISAPSKISWAGQYNLGYFQKCTLSLILLPLYLLLSSAANLCKQFGPRSGQTKYRSWSGFKQFDTLNVFLKYFLEKVNFEKTQQTTTKAWKNTQHAKI